MKRGDLLRHLRENDCVFVREGARHSWWLNPPTIRQAIVSTAAQRDQGSTGEENLQGPRNTLREIDTAAQDLLLYSSTKKGLIRRWRASSPAQRRLLAHFMISECFRRVITRVSLGQGLMSRRRRAQQDPGDNLSSGSVVVTPCLPGLRFRAPRCASSRR